MTRQSGNMLIYILGAIFLLGLLIVLVKGSFQEGVGVDGDKLVVAASRTQQYAGELERGVAYVLQGGVSESDLRFAHPDALAAYGTYSDINTMVFAPSGGGVEYQAPIAGINDGTQWQFFATTHFTDIGTDTAATQKAELIAVLPKVTLAFCNQINRNVKQAIDLAQITDAGDKGCVYEPGEEFAGTFRAGAAVNLLTDARLSSVPAREACIKCADGTYNYYRVLMER